MHEKLEAVGYPVTDELAGLLPSGRLRPGSAVTVGGDLPLLLALAAAAAADTESWAVVGLPQLGVLAAEAMGLDLCTGMVVPHPGRRWPDVVATLAEAVSVVLLGPLGPATGRIGRRLAAVLRRTRAVVLTTGDWDHADVRLSVGQVRWRGVGAGHGLLRGRQVTITATGRGAAGGPPRTTRLWLPGPAGRPAPLSPADALTAEEASPDAASHGGLHLAR